MKQDYTHEFYVTRKCTKMEYYTVRANSMEEAEWEAENGNEYFDFDWEEFDFEIVEIKEEEIPEQQLTLSGILQLVKCNPIEYKRIMTYDPEHYYAVQSFLEDDELTKVWDIIETALNRKGYDVSNAELSMRLYDNELTENIWHDMET